MPVLASIWQKLVIPMHDESEAECVICEGCRLNPVIVDFAEWLATQPWLWLSKEVLR